MKRNLLYTLLVVLGLSGMAKAQLVNSFGLNVGGTMAEHLWSVHTDAYHVPYYYDDAQKWKYGFNAGIFLECFQSDYLRWQTELQFNQKGGVDVDKTHNNKNLATNTNHICWNNYAKFRYELYSGIPYILLGARLEYVLSQATASAPIARGNFWKLQLTPAVGAGWEFITYGSIKPFIEVIYNPSPRFGPPSYHTLDLAIWNRAIEARVGIRIELQGRKETCPKVYK
jgi:hypothetical protein